MILDEKIFIFSHYKHPGRGHNLNKLDMGLLGDANIIFKALCLVVSDKKVVKVFPI